jgi:hypothetical protein
MALVNLKFEQRRWIFKCYWKLENMEHPPRSPDLTPLDFFLWDYLKNAIYSSKPRTLQDLCHCYSRTVQNICQYVARRCQQGIAACGKHFEHLRL